MFERLSVGIERIQKAGQVARLEPQRCTEKLSEQQRWQGVEFLGSRIACVQPWIDADERKVKIGGNEEPNLGMK